MMAGFMQHVEFGDCWNWTSSLDSDGYGKWSRPISRKPYRRRKVLAHRFSYEVFVGKIPQGLVLHHICHNRRCVNPDHLSPITVRENVLESPRGLARRNQEKACCKRGHPFDAENTRIDRKGGRVCRTCKRLGAQARYWANPEDARERTRLYQEKKRANSRD